MRRSRIEQEAIKCPCNGRFSGKAICDLHSQKVLIMPLYKSKKTRHKKLGRLGRMKKKVFK